MDDGDDDDDDDEMTIDEVHSGWVKGGGKATVVRRAHPIGECRAMWSRRIFLLLLVRTAFALFLPYGAQPPPRTNGRVNFAVKYSAARSPTAINSLDVVSDEPLSGEHRLLLVRGEAPRWCEEGDDVEVDKQFHTVEIDAGPFASLEDTTVLMRRWITDYWGCHELGGGDGASCFEFGGCHKRCWWRDPADIHVSTRFVGPVDADRARSLLFGPTHSSEPRVSSDGGMRERQSGEGAGAANVITLIASIVVDGSGRHYCGLAPSSSTTSALQLTAAMPP